MKNVNRFLGLALLGGLMASALPAQADTAYHPVYNRSHTATDDFSILDRRQNNVLLPEDLNNVGYPVAFNSIDADMSGFVTREEFYANYTPPQATRVATTTYYTTDDLGRIMPAAGESTSVRVVEQDYLLTHSFVGDDIRDRRVNK